MGLIPALVGTGLGLAILLAAGAVAGAAGSNSSALTQAKGQLLKLSDMPKHWTSQPTASGSSTGTLPGVKQLASCLGVPTSAIVQNPPNVNSPEFDSPAQSQAVTETISVYASAVVAQKQYALITNSKTASCYSDVVNGTLKTQLEASIGSGASIGHVIVTKVVVSHLPGISLTFPVTLSGRTLHVKTVTLFGLKGAEGERLQTTGLNTTFPGSLQTRLASISFSRL